MVGIDRGGQIRRYYDMYIYIRVRVRVIVGRDPGPQVLDLWRFVDKKRKILIFNNLCI